ncbi:hypothetical protein [Mucilaginibacter sp. KACC 22063]|uniref:hypothetical protein n=1 Tax=Mucilaginibacter sp. KACC 22063 TaxID=3025666 RepID=UPI002366094C|nr:hypothetical protein [Mucilaginibacter sp. KACC 22063]WDF55252.1 hypothetical protein PQ461_20170 [Mucilaginibacter sp. KACC 22063]
MKNLNSKKYAKKHTVEIDNIILSSPPWAIRWGIFLSSLFLFFTLLLLSLIDYPVIKTIESNTLINCSEGNNCYYYSSIIIPIRKPIDDRLEKDIIIKAYDVKLKRNAALSLKLLNVTPITETETLVKFKIDSSIKRLLRQNPHLKLHLSVVVKRTSVLEKIVDSVGMRLKTLYPQ